MSKLSVCIYADTTKWFSEEELFLNGNLIDVEFPIEILKQWYTVNNLVEDTAYELGKHIKDVTFNDWYNEVSWAGDCDGLFDFAIEHGYTPTREVEE